VVAAEAIQIIEAFDRAREEAFGTACEPRFLAQTDRIDAGRWLKAGIEAGMTPSEVVELCRESSRPCTANWPPGGTARRGWAVGRGVCLSGWRHAQPEPWRTGVGEIPPPGSSGLPDRPVDRSLRQPNRHPMSPLPRSRPSSAAAASGPAGLHWGFNGASTGRDATGTFRDKIIGSYVPESKLK